MAGFLISKPGIPNSKSKILGFRNLNYLTRGESRIGTIGYWDDMLLVTAMPSGREVPSSIPTCDLKSLVNSDFFPVRVVLSSCN